MCSSISASSLHMPSLLHPEYRYHLTDLHLYVAAPMSSSVYRMLLGLCAIRFGSLSSRPSDSLSATGRPLRRPAVRPNSSCREAGAFCSHVLYAISRQPGTPRPDVRGESERARGSEGDRIDTTHASAGRRVTCVTSARPTGHGRRHSLHGCVYV